jgi:hypothetical protein
MKTRLLFVAFLTALGVNAQVGVGTTTPNAQLDIRSTSQAAPTNTDGMLIPKVDIFPVVNPTALQQGMLVYLTTAVGVKIPGFYYWDFPTLSWIGITSSISSDKDWLETATALAPDDINDDMYHLGRTAIGKISPTAPLDVLGGTGTSTIINNTANFGDNLGGERMGILNTVGGPSTDTASGIRQFISGSGTGARAGVYQELGGSTLGQQTGVANIFANTGDGIHSGIFNAMLGTGNGVHMGVSNILGAAGNGTQYGARNVVTNTGTGTHYGTYNDLSGGGTSFQFGTYNTISNSANADHVGTSNLLSGTGTGVHFGVNNFLSGTGTGTQYGVYSNISNSGSGSHTGVYSYLNGTASGNQFGNYSLVTTSGAGDLYGNYAQVNGTGNGVHYGAYNDVTTTGTATGHGSFNYIRNSTSTGAQVANYNWLTGTGAGTQYGSSTIIANTSNGDHYGSFNVLSGLGTGIHYGTRNDITGTGMNYGTYNNVSSTANNTQTGTNNVITGTGTGQKIGTYNYIDPLAGGVHYGVVSYALKAGSYAGYFQGNVAIGTNVGNPYILPPSRGLNTQIMQTDGAGNVTWQYPGTALNPTCWLTTGNSGLTAGTNFMGTTDAVSVIFKSNNIERLRINPTDGEIVAGATASPYTGDMVAAVATPALTFAMNGYSAQNGSGTWGEILAASTTNYSAVQGVYGGSGAGAGVLGNYNGSNASIVRSGMTGVVNGSAVSLGGVGVYGANQLASGNQRMGVLGTYNAAAFGLGVIGVAFGGGIPTGNLDIAVVGWRASNANYSGYFNGNHVIANGTKSASVGTSKGNQLLYVTETPGVWFEDIGRGQLVNGTIEIKLDPLFLETVAIDDQHPMSVFLQEEGDSNGLYVIPGKDGFVVREKNGGHSGIAFSYRIMAKRLHFQDHRFGNDQVWGAGDTRKYNQDAPPPPIDYNENVRFQETQKRNYKPTPMPQGFTDYFKLQQEAEKLKTQKGQTK